MVQRHPADSVATCAGCGAQFAPPTQSGQRRLYCCQECYLLLKTARRLGVLLEGAIPRMRRPGDGARRATALRSLLWGMCNRLNAVGHPQRAQETP